MNVPLCLLVELSKTSKNKYLLICIYGTYLKVLRVPLLHKELFITLSKIKQFRLVTEFNCHALR